MMQRSNAEEAVYQARMKRAVIVAFEAIQTMPPGLSQDEAVNHILSIAGDEMTALMAVVTLADACKR